MWPRLSGEVKLEQVLTLYLMYPGITREDVARRLRVSSTWVSTLTRSDMFRARLRELQEKERERLLEETRYKVVKTAHKALDETFGRLGQPTTSDKFVADSTKTLLEAIGMGRKEEGIEGGNVHVHFSAEDIRGARELIGVRATSLKVIAGDPAGKDKGEARRPEKSVPYDESEKGGT